MEFQHEFDDLLLQLLVALLPICSRFAKQTERVHRLSVHLEKSAQCVVVRMFQPRRADEVGGEDWRQQSRPTRARVLPSFLTRKEVAAGRGSEQGWAEAAESENNVARGSGDTAPSIGFAIMCCGHLLRHLPSPFTHSFCM